MAKTKKKVSGTKCKVPKTKKFGDKNYKVSTKIYNKRDADAAADRHRKGGKKKLARVIPNPCGKGYRVAKYG